MKFSPVCVDLYVYLHLHNCCLDTFLEVAERMQEIRGFINMYAAEQMTMEILEMHFVRAEMSFEFL